jgi:SPOR domain
MGHVRRTLVFLAILLVGATAAVAMDGPTPAAANSGAASAPDDKPDAASTAQRMLDAGVKFYQDGKDAQAIRAFSKVLSAGGLQNAQIARALYYRGLAYRRKDKPGLAISDLTSAVWLKNGLSPTEQQDALSQRVAAYRDAGISDAPGISASVPVAEAPSGWETAMNGQTLASQTVASQTPASTTGDAYVPPPTAMAPIAAAPSPSTSTSSSGGIGGFFSSITNMFGGSSPSNSAASSPPPPPVTTTASVGQSNSTPSAGWSTTEVDAAPLPPPQPPPQAAAEPAPFVTKVAAAPPAAPAPVATAATGKYQVQVASVRTRQEAYALSVRLVSQHGSELGGRKPSIDESVIGSMGTFYRVRLGPFASTDEPKRLCGSFRASGFDCLVVTQ